MYRIVRPAKNKPNETEPSTKQGVLLMVESRNPIGLEAQRQVDEGSAVSENEI